MIIKVSDRQGAGHGANLVSGNLCNRMNSYMFIVAIDRLHRPQIGLRLSTES